MAKCLVLCRAHYVTRTGWHARVALANLPAVLVVWVALASKVRCHLNAGAADLDNWSSRVGDMLSSKGAAGAQGSITGTITKYWLVLNENLLVVVEL